MLFQYFVHLETNSNAEMRDKAIFIRLTRKQIHKNIQRNSKATFENGIQ